MADGLQSVKRRLLRGAVARGDGAGLVKQLTTAPWPATALQLIGDGLLTAMSQHVDDAPPLAADCIAELRARDWLGDEELADQLQAGAAGSSAPLSPLPVDLEELAMVLEGDPSYGGGQIDLHTGEVWPDAVIDNMAGSDEEFDVEDDPERWLRVHCEGSRPGYRDMEWFIGELEDPDVADRLSIAIGGPGAFRRFKDVLARWPDLMELWFGFSEERQRGRARSWLADQGYAARPNPSRE